MFIFLVVVTIYVALVLIFQTGLIGRYCRWLGRTDFNPRPHTPAAAIFLSVRGDDPSLHNCLVGLANQSYDGEFKVLVAIDHENDPAIPTVQHVANQHPDLFDVLMAEPPTGECSLKCDRLVQLTEQLDEKFEIVCLIDADTIPDRLWLTSLVNRFQDEAVAAVSGNRWFHPQQQDSPHRNSLGSLLRYLWNSAAIVQMYIYGIAWGGSLAIRRKAMDDTGLANKWSRALFDDVMICDHFREHDMRFETVPELLLVNREETSVGGAIRWMKRQLLDARLYQSKWPLVLAHAISSTALWLILMSLIPILLAFNVSSMIWTLSLLVVLWISNFLVLVWIEKSASANIHRRLEYLDASARSAWLNGPRLVTMILMIPVLQFIHCYATIWALTTRTMTWRQCRYEFRGPFSVKLKEYETFLATDVETSID